MIWVNGTFGVGKTTTATQLVVRHPGLRLFDPECVGSLLMNTLADHEVSDFQHLPSWRRLVPVVAHEVMQASGQDLVIAQSILDESIWDEVLEGFTALGHPHPVHVVLVANPEVLRQRIIDDSHNSGAAEWRLDHLPDHVAARAWLTRRADLVVDSTDLTVDEAVDLISSAISSAHA